MTTIVSHQPLLVEELLPSYDATAVVHRLIDGELDAVHEAVLDTDMLDVPQTSPAVRGLFAARGAGERVINALMSRPTPEAAVPDSMCLRDLDETGDWVKLGADPPQEFAFGVIGRFWGGETVWEQISAEEFATFAIPGYAKIACEISLRPYGSRQTLVSYEARTLALDADSRTTFLRYWRVVNPGVRIVMQAFLKAADAKAKEA